MLIDQETIDNLARKIVQEFQPERIILFGSYAYGNPTEDSDMDLLIIMPFEGKGSHKALEMMQKLRLRIPVDLVVRTPEEVRQRLAWNDFFLREIMEKGKVLYESAIQGNADKETARQAVVHCRAVRNPFRIALKQPL